MSKPLRIHYILHVPFESLGCMKDYLLKQSHNLTSTRVYDRQALPDINDLDWLIIMGGPMGVHDEKEHPWLTDEKIFIKACIDAGKTVLGVCLGAQLIAHVLGAEVQKNTFAEIGWHSVKLGPEASHHDALGILPQEFTALHWHGDTFATPENSVPLGYSEACANQGFVYREKVLALQFHLEMTHASVEGLIERCAHELDGSKYVQDADEILSNREGFQENNRLMYRLLDKLVELTVA